jgi:hypothetical protein
MTSSPKTPSSTSKGTAPLTDTAAARGLDARNPMIPPALRMPAAPSGGLGMPADT